MLAEQHVHERAGAVDGAIQITPAARNLQVCLVHVPSAAHRAASAPAQSLGQGGAEFGLPLPDGFSLLFWLTRDSFSVSVVGENGSEKLRIAPVCRARSLQQAR